MREKLSSEGEDAVGMGGAEEVLSSEWVVDGREVVLREVEGQELLDIRHFNLLK